MCGDVRVSEELGHKEGWRGCGGYVRLRETEVSMGLGGEKWDPPGLAAQRSDWACRRRRTFQAQVSLQSHGSVISFLPFNVFHFWQDNGRRSWGAGIPSVSWKGTECGHFP